MTQRKPTFDDRLRRFEAEQIAAIEKAVKEACRPTPEQLARIPRIQDGVNP